MVFSIKIINAWYNGKASIPEYIKFIENSRYKIHGTITCLESNSIIDLLNAVNDVFVSFIIKT